MVVVASFVSEDIVLSRSRPGRGSGSRVGFWYWVVSCHFRRMGNRWNNPLFLFWPWDSRRRGVDSRGNKGALFWVWFDDVRRLEVARINR